MKRSFYTIGSLVILLIAAFVFVLIPIFAGGRGNVSGLPPVGSYDGVDITYEQGSDFTNYVANYADYFKNQNIEINDSNYYYIFDYAFKTTVNSLAQKKFVEKAGYVVPNVAVKRALRPYFNDENGEYSERLYRLADETQVADLMKNIERSLVSSRYTDDCFGSNRTFAKQSLYGMKHSNGELDFVQSLNSTKRSFEMASFDMANYPDSEKMKYGTEPSDLFKRFDFSLITAADKETADIAFKRVTGDEITFEDGISTYSKKNYSDSEGKITNTHLFQIREIIKNDADKEKVFALKKGEMSSPIETTIGYTIFKSNEDPVEFDSTNADEVKVVYNYITSKEYSTIETYFKDSAERLRENATDNFSDLAEKYGAKHVEVPAFPLNYSGLSLADKLDTSLEGLSGADTNEDFLKTAFSLKEGELSKPVVNGTHLLVLKLREETNETPKSASEILAKVTPTPAEQATASSDTSTETTGTTLSENAKTETAETETLNDEETAAREKLETLSSEISSFDTAIAEQALYGSPKLKNNLSEVYYKYIVGNK